MARDEIEARNSQLVEQRIGHVELSVGMFSEEQRQYFEKVLALVDRNPVVEWKRNDPNHNRDFCLIEGKLEPVKEFHMKCAYLAGVSIKADGQPVIVEAKGEVLVTVPVTVTKGDRAVTMNGGSSSKEVDKYNNNGRWLHDALARAQTRGMKVALENLLGFAFINLVIQAVFGGYEVREDESRDVTPERAKADKHKPDPGAMPTESRRIGTRIWRRLVDARDRGFITEAEQTELWSRVQHNVDMPHVLANIEEDVKAACTAQGVPQWQSE